MKRILNIALKFILVTGIMLLFVFANNKQEQVICPEFVVELNYGSGDALVSRYYIRQLVTESKIRVKGQPLGSIPLDKIHKVIAASPFVKDVNVSMDVNGLVRANVNQREPIVRIIDENGKHFYLDRDGYRIPLSHEYPARVVVANGKINSDRKSSNSKLKTEQVTYKNLSPDLQKVYKTASYLQRDEFLKALAEQIYLDHFGEIELIPKIGDYTILVGDTTLFSEKFEKLKAFYSVGNSKLLSAEYKTVNLKYRDQIVCKK